MSMLYVNVKLHFFIASVDPPLKESTDPGLMHYVRQFFVKPYLSSAQWLEYFIFTFLSLQIFISYTYEKSETSNSSFHSEYLWHFSTHLNTKNTLRILDIHDFISDMVLLHAKNKAVSLKVVNSVVHVYKDEGMSSVFMLLVDLCWTYNAP